MSIKKNMLIILYFIIVNCIIILSINYMIGNDIEEFPYGLSENYIVLHTDNNEKKNSGFDFLNLNKNITVIAETNDKLVIGLYDPTMKYYINSTKFINPKVFRYFSSEDYTNKHRVGIVTDSISNIGQNIDMSKIENFYKIDVINIFDTNSLIAENTSRVVMNLFSIEPSKITTIYIDSPDINKIEGVKNEIKKYGYEEMSVENKKPILKTIYNSLQGKRYVKFIMYSSGFAYFSLLYVLAVYLFKYDKYLYISRMFGATFTSMLKLVFTRVFLTCILINLFSSSLMLVYLERLNKNYMTSLNFLKVQIFLTASFMIVFLVKYFILFKKSKQIMR